MNLVPDEGSGHSEGCVCSDTVVTFFISRIKCLTKEEALILADGLKVPGYHGRKEQIVGATTEERGRQGTDRTGSRVRHNCQDSSLKVNSTSSP